uniref:Vacuolar protein sorting-associated protein 18 homolog n=1 Tax=Crassostrea virginica TaxID=6565 RepID=A0A8B8BI17_CRAVI|nr:vacuolar protein sorting-associated protein 18 homolog [Crassostrea virginica]
MASILDQYEEESARATSLSTVTPLQVPIGPGYIDARTDLDTPIFSKKKINFKPSDPLTHVVVSSNFLVMAMNNNLLLRLDLEHPDQQEEIELPKALEDKVYRLFLDPTGKHLIICMESTENLYLSRNSRKPRSIGKLKGHLINAVAWNLQNTNENTTGAILLGTSRGLIFETELTDSGDSRFFQGSLDQYLKQLFSLAKDKIVPITGLEFDRMPSDSMTEYKYYILATTPGRLYQFVGNVSKSTDPPLFQQLFMQYESGAAVLELPGEFGYSELTMYRPRHTHSVKSFAWMTGPGVYHGEIDVSGSAGPQSVTLNTKLIRSISRDGEEKPQNPLSMVMTEFHVLLLFPDRLKVMCVLNEQLIYEDIFPDRFGRLLGLCSDPVKGTIWAFTGQSIFKYKVTRNPDVWQMYLDKNEFELAKDYCRDNAAQLDRVLTKQAEYLFEKGQYQESAMMYAQTQNSFEEIALKFIKLDGKDALKSFIQKKLSSLRTQDKTQITMLVTWLIEIFLNQLGEMKEQGQDESEEYRKVQEEFRMFLAQPKNKECVSNNRGVVYDLIASHGDVEDMVFFAVLMQDFEKVISHHIQHDNYTGALHQLSKQSDVELIYKFSPLLMQYIPKETVALWISRRDTLAPMKLIPALVQYDHNKYREQGNEAIKYLEFCIEQLDNKDQAIHNYLLSLYAKLKPDQLMTYLNIQGTDEDTICYDLKYALRLCAEHGHKRACVHIYSLMGLYEEAVDLALQVDVDLAKQQADKPEEDDNDLRKKLWLRIARHVVEEEKDVKRAMDFLHDCELLKIEDILPFFPDFVTIDHFKDAIVTSLQEYNHHIEQLKEEMDDATRSAEEIRKEIQGFRNKYAFVNAIDKCAACNFPLMARSFYLFPCQHKFHSDCLIEEVLPNLTNKKRQRVEELQRKVAENEDARTMSVAMRADNPSDRSKDTKAELDDLVASECIYCGDIMVRSIDQPFVDEDESDLILSGWL